MTIPDPTLAEELALSRAFEIDRGLLESLPRLPVLRRVKLDSSIAVDDSVVEAIARVPLLRELDLAYTGITDASLGHLAGHRRLKSLRLTWCTQITDEGLRALSRTPLRELDLAFTRITDAGLLHLVGMRSLERLDLTGCRVSSAAIARLPAGTQIVLGDHLG